MLTQALPRLHKFHRSVTHTRLLCEGLPIEHLSALANTLDSDDLSENTRALPGVFVKIAECAQPDKGGVVSERSPTWHGLVSREHHSPPLKRELYSVELPITKLFFVIFFCEQVSGNPSCRPIQSRKPIVSSIIAAKLLVSRCFPLVMGGNCDILMRKSSELCIVGVRLLRS
jgi:hypothetical protein